MVDTKKLHEEVKKILSRDDIKYVIGYKKGTYGFQTSPIFASKKEDVEKLIFSPLCVNNLSLYVKFEDGNEKVGLVVKGCDSRSLIQMIQERRIPREKLFIIGISCTGVADPKKMHDRFPNVYENIDVVEEEGKFIFTINGKTHRIPKEELVFDKCLHCEYPIPIIYDTLVGEKIKQLGQKEYKEVKKFEKKSLKEKWSFWEENFDRCIRCYACRNVCPMCYCEECMAGQLNPQWLRRSVNLSENTAWHIMRAFHLSGRCTECGECERACPMDIPLMSLNKKIEKDVKELFDYTAGIDVDEKPLLAMFKPDDPEDFIK